MPVNLSSSVDCVMKINGSTVEILTLSVITYLVPGKANDTRCVGYHKLHECLSCHWTDINECDVENGGCSDICNNEPGSWSCACPEGFQLDTDQVTCIGKFTISATVLNLGHNITILRKSIWNHTSLSLRFLCVLHGKLCLAVVFFIDTVNYLRNYIQGACVFKAWSR